MKIERAQNTMRNIIWGVLTKTISIAFPFITRSVIIYKLGVEYIGLNSLFSSILQILSLSELGLTSAITFSMYKPIAEGNQDLICSLLNVYRKLYRRIGTVIMVIGIVLIPVLPYIVKKDSPANINLSILYIMYLINTAISYYLFSYKAALLSAHQRNDILNKIQIAVLVLQNILQVITIIFTQNYYAYVIILITSTVLYNVLTHIITTKKYPSYYCKGELPQTEKNDLKKQVSGLVIMKVCGVLRNSFDSIVLSSFLGLVVLGKYQNYFFINSSLCLITTIILTSMTAGLGNRVATESRTSNYVLFKKINFLYMWIAGVLAVCMMCLSQDFIKLWIGKAFWLDLSIVVSLTLYFYTLKLSEMVYIMKEAAGLWWNDRYRPLIEGIVNLVLNIILVRFFGVLGVIWSTILTMWISEVIFMTRSVFKNYFKRSIKEYYFHQFSYAIRTVIVAAFTYVLLLHVWPVTQLSFFLFFVKGCLVFVFSNILFTVLSFKDPLFKEAVFFLKSKLIISI